MNKKSTLSGKSNIIVTMIIFFALLFSSCATFHHKYIMKGSILKQQGNEIYVCIGTKDGAKEGKIYNVYHMVKVSEFDFENSRIPMYIYGKKITGKVKINKIVNEHYAKAIIISGKVKKGYSVDLK